MPNQQNGGVKPFTLPAHSDLRGDLTALDFIDLGLSPKRVFWVKNVPVGTIRGKHFHKLCNQLLVCMNGRIKVNIWLSDGTSISETLNQNDGIFLPIKHYVEYVFLDTNSELLVLADQFFDPTDVFTIEDWDEATQ
jgi:dTDP-4-dehydrorhamnose 3,5-epimerase-like enzyme